MKKTLLSLCLVTAFANGEMIRDNDKEVVIDTDRNLMWQDDIDAGVVKKWEGAIDYCDDLSLAGFDDWKLPEKDKLLSLYNPLKEYFKRENSTHSYWSSSRDDKYDDSAWEMSFLTGESYRYRKFNALHVRCVRDSKPLNLVSLSSLTYQYRSNQDVAHVLKSSSKEYTLHLNDKIYTGTRQTIFAKAGIKAPFSNAPFIDIQQRTQKQLNEFLTIPTISLPTLPAPVQLTKDEFETKAEFNDRVKQKSSERESEIMRLQDKYRLDVEERNTELEKRKGLIEAKKIEFLFQNLAIVMGEPTLSNPKFDAETSTMYVDLGMSQAGWSKKIGIMMSDREKAKMFKENMTSSDVAVSFNYANDAFVLEKIDIDFAGKSYLATLTDADYKPELVAITLENKKVAFNELQNPNLVDKYQISALGYSDSANAKGLNYTDDLAPLVKGLKQSPIDPKKWLFAISVEKYDEADPVIYATNSANSFISVMQKRLGIDERHTYALLNDKATTGGIKGSLERLLQNVQPGDSIYFYYSGHGIPDPKEGEPYILPRDVIADYVTREKDLMARSLYKKLSDSSASRIVAFVDSCYSGRTDGISNIKGAAAGHFKSKTVEFDKEKMAVFTAGTNGQFSNAFPEKGNRLFSYYLTKALATKENLDLDTLSAEVYANVKEESLKMGDIKRQEPQIEGNRMIGLK